MKKVLSVIKREYLQIVRTKGFIIATILGPILIASFIFIPILVSVVSVGRQERIGIVDLSQTVFESLDKKLDYKLKDGRRRYLLEKFPASQDPKQWRPELNQRVLNKELSAYIYIPSNILEGGTAEYVSQHVSDFDKLKDIHQALNSIIIEKRLIKEGLDPEKIAGYIKGVKLKTIKVTKKGEEEETGGTFIISYLLVIILYMTLFFYGTAIMRGVIEEKNSRVVEIVLSSLKPFQLMVGKILGIGAVGITQYAIWALFGFSASHYSRSLIGSFVPSASSFKLPSIPAYIFIYFVIFFILGYFLYGTFYAAIGSMVNSEKEAQQLLFPVTMFLVIPVLLMMYIIRSPNSPLAVTLSLIPFFAPILMLLRICILLPSFLQVSSSILILVLTIFFMVWLTAKIYRVGILMYGKRPGLREVVKWIRYK
ncbi:MAG: ABC transporter permease [Candidatus Aminicenantales bacterium]